jgi:hypothetical protein
MSCEAYFKEVTTKERPLKMIDSNIAITGTFTLAQGWQKRAIPTNNLWKTRSKWWSGKVSNKRTIWRVLVNEPTIFLNDEVLSSEVADSHSGFQGRRNLPKGNLVENLAQKHNHNKEPSQRRFDGML